MNKINIETSKLKEKVQGLRDRAREILRMKLISDLLQDLFFNDKYIKEAEANVESAKLSTARAKYRLETLPEADPDFEIKKKDLQAVLDRTVVYEADTIRRTNEAVATAHKNIERIDRNIAEIEEGKVKVAIDMVKSLSDKLIEASL